MTQIMPLYTLSVSTHMNNFYLDLDKVFQFHLGKILLATASPPQLKIMMAKDWPYFTNFSQHMDQCLNNNSCKGVNNILRVLGKTLES